MSARAGVTLALLAAALVGVAPAASDGRARRCVPGQGRRCAKPHSARPAPPATGPVSAVSASEREYSIALSRDSVPAGTVFVEVRNRGMDPHDLHLRGPDGADVAFATQRPGEHTSQRLQLARGSWYLYCSLPGHEEAGMHATLTVG
jgi:plastocyanin